MKMVQIMLKFMKIFSKRGKGNVTTTQQRSYMYNSSVRFELVLFLMLFNPKNHARLSASEIFLIPKTAQNAVLRVLETIELKMMPFSSFNQ